MKITLLGMGAMGSRMADRLTATGHEVERWNRTGARQSPRAAVAAAELVIAMLRDDEASRATWLGAQGALAGMRADAVAIESSTVSVGWVHELAAAARAVGVGFLDAPVLGSRPQAEAGQLIHLIGGDGALIERARPAFAALGTTQLHAGPTGSGAALKLIANSLLAIQVAAVAELLARATSLGLDQGRMIELLGQTPLMSPTAKGVAALMLAGKHAPLFPVALVAKDLRYALGDRAKAMPLAEATIGVFERAADADLADANMTAVATLYG